MGKTCFIVEINFNISINRNLSSLLPSLSKSNEQHSLYSHAYKNIKSCLKNPYKGRLSRRLLQPLDPKTKALKCFWNNFSYKLEIFMHK